MAARVGRIAVTRRTAGITHQEPLLVSDRLDGVELDTV